MTIEVLQFRLDKKTEFVKVLVDDKVHENGYSDIAEAKIRLKAELGRRFDRGSFPLRPIETYQIAAVGKDRNYLVFGFTTSEKPERYIVIGPGPYRPKIFDDDHAAVDFAEYEASQ